MFYCSSQAIVLGKEEFSESDLFFIFFSQKTGRIKVLAKGARKINAKLKPFLKIGNLVNLELVFKNQYRLLGVELIDNFSSLRKNFEYLFRVISDLEFAKEMIIFTEKDESLWKLLFSYLKVANLLAKKKSKENLIVSSLFFKIKLINLLGFLPSFEEFVSLEKIKSEEKKLFLPLWQARNFSELVKICQKTIKKENLPFLEKKINSYLKKIKKKVYE